MGEIVDLDESLPNSTAANELKVTVEVDPSNFALQSAQIGGLEWILTFEIDANSAVLTVNCSERETKLWSVDMIIKVEIDSNSANYNNFYKTIALGMHSGEGSYRTELFPIETRACYEHNNQLVKVEVTMAVNSVWQEDLAKITPFGSCYVTMDEHELYVSRELLSMNSRYFYEMFEKNNSVNVLEDVTFNELKSFLVAVYPLGFRVKIHNYREMLRIARKFSSTFLTQKCLEFIANSDFSLISLDERFKIAQEYDLPSITTTAVNTMSQEDIENLACGRETLSDSLKLLLFERLIRIHDDKPVADYGDLDDITPGPFGAYPRNPSYGFMRNNPWGSMPGIYPQVPPFGAAKYAPLTSSVHLPPNMLFSQAQSTSHGLGAARRPRRQ